MVRTNPHHKWGTKVSVAEFPSQIDSAIAKWDSAGTMGVWNFYIVFFLKIFRQTRIMHLCHRLKSGRLPYHSRSFFQGSHQRSFVPEHWELGKKGNPNTSDYKRICVVFDHHVSWLNHLNPTSLMVKSLKSQRFMVRFPGGWRPCQGAQKRHCSGWRWPLSPLLSQRSSLVHVYRYTVTKIYKMIHVCVYIYTHYNIYIVIYIYIYMYIYIYWICIRI